MWGIIAVDVPTYLKTLLKPAVEISTCVLFEITNVYNEL